MKAPGLFSKLVMYQPNIHVCILMCPCRDLAKLAEACCSYVLNEAAALSCLNLLDCLSAHEEAACVMRARLSPGALVASRHLQSKLEKLEVK